MTEHNVPHPPALHGNGRAFTTAELLVVVGIVAVLIAIVITVFGKVRALIQSWM